jgi:aminoglycoside/choline kinase family phosphotransferase
VRLSPRERRCFADAAGWLARRIAAWPRGFVHRDYQSRNLMVRAGALEPTLTWIDFQDALQGPRVYDLVALLTDSYQTLDRSFVEARLDDYANAAGLDASQRAALGHEFDLVTVQRKLKDAGRFIYFDRVRGDASFLPFFRPSVQRVRDALERLNDVAELSELDAGLRRWVVE